MIKKLIKTIISPFADVIVRASSVFPQRVDWALQDKLQPHLFKNAFNLKGVFVPIDDDQTFHILKRKHFSSYPADDTGLPVPKDLPGGATSEITRGKDDAEKIQMQLFGGASIDGKQILEFGCGTGRLLRHFRHIAEQNEIWGVDLCETYIKWLQENFGKPYRFFACTTMPHLPFEDNYFDYIYAGSVFTHIYDLSDFWFLELRRILKPEGMLLITVHDNNTISEMMTDEYKTDRLAEKLKEFNGETGVLDSDFATFTIGRRPQDCQVFHDRAYLTEHLSSYFEVMKTEDTGYGYQSSILLKKMNG